MAATEVKRVKRGGVFMKLFASYMCILGFLLLVESCVSVMVFRTGREQARTFNLSLMQLIKNECDNQINNIYSRLDQLALDSRVQTLSNVKGSFEVEDQYTAYSLYSELGGVKFSSEEYRLLYVYFANTDSVISATGNMSLELYHQLYYQNLGISLQELREYLTMQHYHDIHVLSRNEGTNEIMYTMTSLTTDMGEASATIVIQLTADAIDERIRSAKWDEDVLVAVINSNDQFVNSAEFAGQISDLTYKEVPVELNFSIRLDDVNYMGVAMRSEAADWIYLLLTPLSVVESSTRQMWLFSLLGIGLCLIAGFLVSWYLTDKNYSPVQGLVDLFKSNHSGNAENLAAEGQNEYQWLENRAVSLFKENKNFQQTLEQNQKRLQEFYLFRLLTNSYESLNLSEKELLRKSGITDGIWRVVSLSVGIPPQEEIEKIEDTGIEPDLQRFIIGNVAGELLNEVYPAYVLDIGESVIVMVRLEAMDTDNYDRMWEALAKAHDLIRDRFHFYMQICAGSAKEGLENVHLSYQEARETQEYAPLLETYYINYDNIKDRRRKYYYPTEAETRIMTAIADGLPEPAIQGVKEILRVNYQENHISARMLSCLFYDLLGTLVKSADLAGCGDFFEENRVDPATMGQGTPTEMEKRFDGLIRELCSAVEGTKEGSSANLVDKLQKYIQENYQNPDLNISQAALHLEMTPAYISSVYKKQTGVSLLKYINQTRVDQAIRLLKEGNSVNETARLCGFSSSRVFIRVFKECTGMTSGQIKRD